MSASRSAPGLVSSTIVAVLLGDLGAEQVADDARRLVAALDAGSQPAEQRAKRRSGSARPAAL
jgi:hypothetical protein